jgi:hypothetical protein
MFSFSDINEKQYSKLRDGVWGKVNEVTWLSHWVIIIFIRDILNRYTS